MEKRAIFVRYSQILMFFWDLQLVFKYAELISELISNGLAMSTLQVHWNTFEWKKRSKGQFVHISEGLPLIYDFRHL